MNLNVFNWSYNKRYYLTHPWKWFKELWYNIKAAYHRAKYGWCYCDVWNWNDWFCSVVPSMLRHMKDYGCAYPGGEPFETPEKWHDWLYEMAHKIEHLAYDEWLEDNNEYSKDYEKTFEDGYDQNNPEVKEIRKKYYKRCEELAEIRQQVLEEVFLELGRRFDCLWD